MTGPISEYFWSVLVKKTKKGFFALDIDPYTKSTMDEFVQQCLVNLQRVTEIITRFQPTASRSPIWSLSWFQSLSICDSKLYLSADCVCICLVGFINSVSFTEWTWIGGYICARPWGWICIWIFDFKLGFESVVLRLHSSDSIPDLKAWFWFQACTYPCQSWHRAPWTRLFKPWWPWIDSCHLEIVTQNVTKSISVHDVHIMCVSWGTK